MKGKNYYIASACIVALAIGILYCWKLRQVPHNNVQIKTSTFSKLPGWDNIEARESLHAFQISCRAFLKQKPDTMVGSKHIALHAEDWYPTCRAALAVPLTSEIAAKNFFEHWLAPIAFYQGKPMEGLFTGYYMPQLKGSLTKTAKFNVPIYGVPNDLITIDLGIFDPQLKYHRKIIGRVVGNKLVPYYTRGQIDKGAIKKKAPVIAWVGSMVDRQFLEIEGSAVIELQDGKKIYIGYAGENGAKYTPLAQILIQKGVMTRDNASMQRIRKYFKTHPAEIVPILNQNKSFVFFNNLRQDAALGTQGVPLTPGYSLAVDRTWVPLGAPIWLNTTRPTAHSKQTAFQRLLIAQDTGGAIRGAVRGDVYWGAGEEATFVAGHMKNKGLYWLLLPKHIIENLQNKTIT
jgi:membrane-bound lytic murein transglycosylase A